MMIHNARQNERGNALFYILIAVSLLAALSYAVSKSMSGSGTNINGERAQLAATEMIEYSNIVAQATGQLRLRGCEIEDLNLNNPVVAGYTNASAPSDGSCDIFSITGGGVQWREIPTEWLDTAQSAQNEYGKFFYPNSTCVINVGVNGNTNCDETGGNEELIMVVPWIRKEICLALNNKLGIQNPSGDPPQEYAHAWDWIKFTGTLSGNKEIGEGGEAATYLAGKTAGCFEGAGTNTPPENSYHYYRVIVKQ